MLVLSELQARFSTAILEDDDAPLHGLIGAAPVAPKHALSIYRNAVFGTLRAALRSVYPVIRRLLGEPFFDRVADEYIRVHPSMSGDLHAFGSYFALLLAAHPRAGTLSYLQDTARLEWLWHGCFHAADHPPLALDRLARLPPEAYARVCFRLHPAARLFTSNYPVDRIWQANQSDTGNDEIIDADSGGVRLLLRRADDQVVIQALEAAGFAFLHTLAAAQPLSWACETALQIDASFDAPAFLSECALRQVIVDVFSS